MFVIVLAAPSTQGLKADLAVVEQTIKNRLADKVELGTVLAPMNYFVQPGAAKKFMISAKIQIDAVIFFEHVFDHPLLMAARHRILIPNPEWLQSKENAESLLTEMWHKTHIGLTALSKNFANQRHAYIGFTSIDFSGNTPDFNRFIHFRGASTQKQTDVVLTTWRKHPEWPELSVQSYFEHPQFQRFPEWLQWKNIRMKYCFVSPEEYRAEVSMAGVHLCPSSIEGFGHYINEARSIGALVVTTDAPPMNELIDSNCGVLITPVRIEEQNYAKRHIIDVAGFEGAVRAVIEMPVDRRKALGANARRRYVEDRKRFQNELVNQINRLMGL